MNKRDLIELRDSVEDAAVKQALRYAIKRIYDLENQLREVHTLCKAAQRAASLKEDE